MKTSVKIIGAISLCGVLAAASSASAGVITPLLSTDVGSSTSSTTTIGSPRTIDAAVSGLGLSGGGTSGDILSETHDAGQSATHWLSDSGIITAGVSLSEVLTFDLGGSFDIDTIYIWTYNRPERARGVRTFDIAFSTDGGANFSPAVSAASLGMADFDIGATGGISSVQTRTITAQSGVTDIRFTNIANFGASDRLALPEIRFGEVIPEPGSLAMLGLGGLLIARRRR